MTWQPSVTQPFPASGERDLCSQRPAHALDQQHRGRLRQRHPGAAGAFRSRSSRARSPTLLGANGAGKTTTLKAISGVLRTERGEVTKGSITFDGKRIDGMRAFDVTKLGIAQVFEGRRVFEHLTTEENLIAGGHLQREAAQGAATASSGSMPISRCSRTRRSSCRAISPAASSRCWRSAAR